MDMLCFQGITVGFPTGPHAAAGHANWVHWSAGDLRLDVVSRAMVFVPSGGQMHAKPLGCLLGAAAFRSASDGARTFEVETNDTMHSLVRMSFSSPRDEASFEAHARDAEVSCSKMHALGPVAEPFAFSGDDAFDCGLGGVLREHFRDRAPLIYSGAEIFGPEPNGDHGNEVLLGRGAAVVLDAQEHGRVGEYQLLFFSEEVSVPPQPLFRPWHIGPRTRLLRQQPAEDEYEPAVCFDFSPNGEPPLTLAFDDQVGGEAFLRDMRVRMRLVQLSLKTSRGRQVVGNLQGELAELQRRQWIPALRRMFFRIMFLCLCLVLAQTGLMLAADPKQPPLEAANAALHDFAGISARMLGQATALGRATCNAVSSDLVPTYELRRCIALPEGARDCLSALLPSSNRWMPRFTDFAQKFVDDGGALR